MTRLLRLFAFGPIFAFVALGSLSQARAGTTGTVVLVHGALFTASGWEQVRTQLRSLGVSTIAVNVPGRAGDTIDPRQVDLRAAATRVCAALETADGPVTLVGHSQGGAVITQANAQCGAKVNALVFMAAVAPLPGETAFDLLEKRDWDNILQCAVPSPEAGLLKVIRTGPVASLFFGDVPESEWPALVASMVDEPLAIGGSKLEFDLGAYQAKAKYYIETVNDQIVSLETQKKFQARLNLKKVYTLETSHSPFLSQPGRVAEILAEVVARSQ